MSAVFRPRCVACRHMALLGPTDLLVTIAEHGARFAFTCGHCGACSSDRVAPQIVDFLVAHGVQAHLLMPQEDSDAALTEDDLIAFGRQIEALPTSPGGGDQRRDQPTPPATSKEAPMGSRWT